jgi:DNA polymerase
MPSSKSEQSRTPVIPAQLRSLKAARDIAKTCCACPLWRNATQTVFGEGGIKAKIMLVGEQPGDREDLEGRPFVGPAGTLLRKAMQEAALDATEVYITNAVKHFKFQLRGKRRIHGKPSTGEVRACNPWLQHEFKFVKPKLVVMLGTTAVTAVMGKPQTITSLRGKVLELERFSVVATVHPSSLLRIPDKAERARAYKAFVTDLSLAAKAA